MFTVGDLIAVAALVLAVIGIWILIGRMTRNREELTPEHEASLRELEALKTGRIWGDFPQADPRRPITPKKD